MAKKTKKKQSKFDVEPFIRGLPPEAARTQPALPPEVAKLEAQRLFKNAIKVRPLFAKLPDFDVKNLDTLPDRIAALDGAQKAWFEARLNRQANSLKGTRADAEKLRATISSGARFFLRADAAAQATLDDISQGEGLADLVDDLKRLADLVEANAKVFKRAPKFPNDAAAQARRFALALGNGADSAEANAAQARRNQVYAVLEGAVEEVRHAAKWLFRDDPKALAPMLSHYAAEKKRAERKAVPAGATPPQQGRPNA